MFKFCFALTPNTNRIPDFIATLIKCCTGNIVQFSRQSLWKFPEIPFVNHATLTYALFHSIWIISDNHAVYSRIKIGYHLSFTIFQRFFRLHLHEISVVRFHLLDRIHSGMICLNCVGFTRAWFAWIVLGLHGQDTALERYSSKLDHFHKWNNSVQDRRTDLERICQVPYKDKAYPYQFLTSSKRIQSRVNAAWNSFLLLMSNVVLLLHKRFFLVIHLFWLTASSSNHNLYISLYWLTNWCIMAISNFELPLLVRNSTYMAQILCGLNYKVWFKVLSCFSGVIMSIRSFFLFS